MKSDQINLFVSLLKMALEDNICNVKKKVSLCQHVSLLCVYDTAGEQVRICLMVTSILGTSNFSLEINCCNYSK